MRIAKKKKKDLIESFIDEEIAKKKAEKEEIIKKLKEMEIILKKRI